MILKSLKKLVGLVVLSPLFFTGVGCNHLFYYPEKETYSTPESAGVAYEDFTVETEDHEKIRGWVLKTPGENAKGTVLQFHGNAQNMSTHFRFVAWLTFAGYDVITFDYRGYGRSTGSPSREGLVKDGMAVLKYADSHAAEKSLFVFGQSLGGAVSIPALARTELKNLKGVVIESSFASYREIARAKLSDFWLTWPLQWPLGFLVSDSYSPEDDIAKLQVPLFFIHGTQDGVVPIEYGKELFDKATVTDRRFLEMQGAGHSPRFVEGTELNKDMLNFLCRHRAEQPCAAPN